MVGSIGIERSSPAPSLALFYDLLFTAVYGELTKLLAMSIDRATYLSWKSVSPKE